MSRNKLLLIAVLGTLLAVFWQEYNLYGLDYLHPVKNGLLTSADEYSYLHAADKFLDKGIWSSCGSGITCYFVRPPGYGMIYLFCKLISPSNPWIVLKIIQVLGFFFSIVLFSRILSGLNLDGKVNLATTCVYAFTPCFSGFMYFTITEGITPFFMLLSVYTWLNYTSRQTSKRLVFYLAVSSFFLLIRPQLLIFIVLFNLYFLLRKKYRQFLLVSICFLPLIAWNIRTTAISGQWMGLHPIYSYQNNNLFRPSHEKMTDLFRIWEHDGIRFHNSIGYLDYDTTQSSLQLALNTVPEKYRQKVTPVFKEYQLLRMFQKEQFPDKETINGKFRGEQKFEDRLSKLISSLKSENKSDYYLKTPLHSFSELVLSSHLNLNLFQEKFRGNFLVEILRYACVLLVLSCVCVPFLFVFHRKNLKIQALAIGIMILVFYLIYVQRINEERYLTPVLPVGLILCALGFSRFLEKMKSYF